MRISDKKPEFDKIDWFSLGISDKDKLSKIKDILDKPAQVNSIMLELYQLGLKQKQIGDIFGGVSESAVSLRLAGKVGSSGGIAKRVKDQMEQYEQSIQVREECPHSDYLEETLLKFRLSQRKTEDIMFLYVDAYPNYDTPKSFIELLRANRVSEKKAILITKRFFLEDVIPGAVDMEEVEPEYKQKPY